MVQGGKKRVHLKIKNGGGRGGGGGGACQARFRSRRLRNTQTSTRRTSLMMASQVAQADREARGPLPMQRWHLADKRAPARPAVCFKGLFCGNSQIER